MKFLGKFLKPYWKGLLIGPFFKLAEAILELMLPFYMAKIIDIGIANKDRQYIVQTGIWMLLIALVGVGCALVCQYTASKVSQGVGTQMRTALFTHINSFSSHELDQFGTASLINRVTNDVNQVQTGVAMLIRLVIRAPFLCIGGCIMAFTLDRRLSIIVLIVLPVFACILGWTMLRTVPLYRAVQRKLDKLALILRENLSGVRVIRAFSRHPDEEKRFCEENENYSKTAIRVGRISALLNPLTTLILKFSIIAVLWFGGKRVNAGGLETGAIMAFINYLGQILAALIVISQLVVLYTKAFASLGRIQEVLSTAPTVVYPEKRKSEFQADAPMVEFRDVCMRYEGMGEDALKHISFQAQKGDVIGIIGGTGCGKSTLIQMIYRAYDVRQGQVFVQGVDIRDLTKDDIRLKMGIVPQKTVLYTGTIADNLRWGMKDADKETMRWAAETAQAAEFIKRLPEQYETKISQGGVNVSGGQRQRLTIARALVKRPDILILDDSFNALDFVTDKALRAALKTETEEMTCFIVSQRASTIREADMILVMHEGDVVGIGKHSALYENCDIYREICDSQKNMEGVKAS